LSKPANPELAERILELALKSLDGKKPDEINMRKLAEEAGVSPTAIYYYFASKEALFEKIKFRAMAELEAVLESKLAGLGAGAGAKDRLLALARAFVGWCVERPHIAELLMEGLPAEEDLTPELMKSYYAIHDMAKDLLLEARKEAGVAAPADPDLEASLGQACLWGIASQFKAKRIHPRFWAGVEPLVDRFIDLFLEGAAK
jgi:AcrR family transcriptional regulator